VYSGRRIPMALKPERFPIDRLEQTNGDRHERRFDSELWIFFRSSELIDLTDEICDMVGRGRFGTILLSRSASSCGTTS